MARSLNKATLIGNLTRDPELRYTPQGNAVCTFGLATNRQWTPEGGEKKEDAEFHRIVAWNKLAELCSQLLSKGRKVYVEGRLQTRTWTAQDGASRTTTEIVISDMIILDSRREPTGEFDIPEEEILRDETAAPREKVEVVDENKPADKPEEGVSKKPTTVAKKKKSKKEKEEEVEDIPF